MQIALIGKPVQSRCGPAAVTGSYQQNTTELTREGVESDDLEPEELLISLAKFSYERWELLK